MTSGEGNHWLIESPTFCNLCVILRYMSALFLNISMLLAFIQSVDNSLHLFIVLSENEYFLTSNLDPLLMLPHVL